MKRFLLAAVAASLLEALAVPALAAEGIPGATVRPYSGKNQAERQVSRDQWYKANPAECRHGLRPGRQS